MTHSVQYDTAGPQDVFWLGLSFEHSSQTILDAHRLRTRSPFQTGMSEHSAKILKAPPEIIPTIVNMQFSVELYLKCLIWLETGAPIKSGHALTKLFGLVSPSSQLRIKHHYQKFLATNINQIRELDAASDDELEFDQAIKSCDDGFVKWRYAYEFGMGDGLHLAMYIGFGVRRTIVELKPDWDQLTDNLRIPMHRISQ